MYTLDLHNVGWGLRDWAKVYTKDSFRMDLVDKDVDR